MSTEVVIGGRGVWGSIVWTPAPRMVKAIVTGPAVKVLASRIAWRSEPGPLSAVVVTTKTPSVSTSCAASGGAPYDPALSVSMVITWGPGGGVYRGPASAALRARSE